MVMGLNKEKRAPRVPSHGMEPSDKMWTVSMTTSFSMLATLTYLSYRLRDILITEKAGSVVWAVFVIEAAVAVPGLFTRFSILFDAIHAQYIRPRKTEDDLITLPEVDVFITYCGEGLDVIIDTCSAACTQDYPASLFRVIVLDDSRSPEIREVVGKLRNEQFSNIFYASRSNRHGVHSKPGNLNFGVEWADTLSGSTPKFVAVLDVDMIPEPHWLEQTTRALLRDELVGLVCPAQRFYNIPADDPLGIKHDWTRIELLIHMQDLAGEGWCTGSGFVMRREALDQIGGFPVGYLQDDFVTSLLLNSVGWRTVCLPDTLQWGLAPDSISGWIKQRQRWTTGVLQVTRLVCSYGGRNLPFLVRVRGALWGLIDAFEAFAWTATMVAFPLLVATCEPLLPPARLGPLICFATLDFVANSVSDHTASSVLEFRTAIMGRLSVVWLAPYKLIIIFRVFILPKLLGRPLPQFTPGGVPETGESERAARQRSGSCLSVVLRDCNGWMHGLILAGCLMTSVIAIDNSLKIYRDIAQLNGHDSWRRALNILMVRIGWPPLFLLFLVILKEAWVPISYAISPPPLEGRRRMTWKNTQTSNEYPTHRVRELFMSKPSGRFWKSVAIYHVGVFVLHLTLS